MTDLDTTRDALLAHRDFVRALATSLVSDPELAADVEQETWLQALRRRPERAGDPRGWLARTLRNRVKRDARDRARRVAREEAAARPEAIEVEQVREEARVVRAVLGLPREQREVVLLRYRAGLTPLRIATRTETPLATVKTRLRRAHVGIREHLDREHGGDGRRWLLALSGLSAPKRGSAIVALLLIAAAIGGVLFWRSSGADPLPRGPLQVVGESVHEEAGSDVDLGSRPEPARSVASPDGGAWTVLLDREVLVLDADTRPVAGARVRWIAAERVASLSGSREVDGHAAAAFTSASEFAVTDDRGVARIRGPQRIAIQALTEDLWGWTLERPGEPLPLIVTLGELREASVRVTDERGVPRPGVHVARVRRTGGSAFTWIQPQRIGVTSADGVARISFLEDAGEDAGWTLAEPLADRPFVRAVPGEVADLVMPETGSLRIEFVEEDGTPATYVDEVQVDSLHEPNRRDLTDGRPDCRDGVTLLDPVGLGSSFEVRPHSSSMRLMSGRAFEVTGPTRAGETRVVRIVLDGARLRLRGRFVDRDGRPVPRHQAAFHSGTGGWSSRAFTPVSDDDGRFSQVLCWRGERSAKMTGKIRSGPHGDWHFVSWSWPEDSGSTDAEVDLGDITVTIAPLLVSGRVRDALGRPVPGRGIVRVVGTDPHPGTSEEWNAIFDVEDDGSFEVEGLAPPEGELELEVSSRLGSMAVPFRAGEEVSVEFGLCGELFGRVSTQFGNPALLTATLRVPGRGRTAATSECSRGGLFRLREVLPGTYDLELGVTDTGELVYSREGVRIEPGTRHRFEPDPITVRFFETPVIANISVDRSAKPGHRASLLFRRTEGPEFDLSGPDGDRPAVLVPRRRGEVVGANLPGAGRYEVIWLVRRDYRIVAHDSHELTVAEQEGPVRLELTPPE